MGTPDFDLDPPRTVSVWAQDLTAGGDYARVGDADTDWEGTSCDGAPFVFTPPVTGHVYQVITVDYTFSDCGATDDPHGGCVRWSPIVFRADPDGIDLPLNLG